MVGVNIGGEIGLGFGPLRCRQVSNPPALGILQAGIVHFSALMLSRAISLESLISSIGSLLLSFLTFSRSFLRAASRSLTCLPNDSCSRLLVLTSPSNLPIRDRISARSISQALRSRSCRCHSVCRKRITPIGEKEC